jgi:hypothetical protein
MRKHHIGSRLSRYKHGGAGLVLAVAGGLIRESFPGFAAFNQVPLPGRPRPSSPNSSLGKAVQKYRQIIAERH